MPTDKIETRRSLLSEITAQDFMVDMKDMLLDGTLEPQPFIHITFFDEDNAMHIMRLQLVGEGSGRAKH